MEDPVCTTAATNSIGPSFLPLAPDTLDKHLFLYRLHVHTIAFFKREDLVYTTAVINRFRPYLFPFSLILVQYADQASPTSTGFNCHQYGRPDQKGTFNVSYTTAIRLSMQLHSTLLYFTSFTEQKPPLQ